jgi:hypothetical protein
VLFHLGALAAVRVKDELQTYYERKVGEGKNKIQTADAASSQRRSQQTYSSYLCCGETRRKI